MPDLLASTNGTPLVDPAEVIETAGPLFGDGLLVSDPTAGAVFAISAAGEIELVASGFQFAHFWTDGDLLLEPEGTALVADAGSHTVWRIAIQSDRPPDMNGDGTVNTQDVIAFLNAWNDNEPAADFNGDGQINTQDVIAFLNQWNAGC